MNQPDQTCVSAWTQPSSSSANQLLLYKLDQLEPHRGAQKSEEITWPLMLENQLYLSISESRWSICIGWGIKPHVSVELHKDRFVFCTQTPSRIVQLMFDSLSWTTYRVWFHLTQCRPNTINAEWIIIWTENHMQNPCSHLWVQSTLTCTRVSSVLCSPHTMCTRAPPAIRFGQLWSEILIG